MDNSSVSNCAKDESASSNSSPGFAPPVKSEQLPAGKKLTKDLVLSKSKGGNLVEIKKIVVWGQKITDCSIVTEIPELEVASMNANKISSLEHFGQCPNLRELFLRSNCISDIHEIYYLKDLPNLQVLWLAGNPCTKHPKYRSTVIRNLEQLQKLDDTEISPAERASSESGGLLFEEPPARGGLRIDLDERMRPAEDAGGPAAEDNAKDKDEQKTVAATPSSQSPLPLPQTPAPSLPPQPPAPAPPPPLSDSAEAPHAGAAIAKDAAAAEVVAPSGGDEKPAEAETAGAAAASAMGASTLSASSRPGTALAPASQQLPRYALAEVRTAVLRLIRLLDQESLQLVLLTVRSRLETEATPGETTRPQQQQQPGAEVLPTFSLDNL